MRGIIPRPQREVSPGLSVAEKEKGALAQLVEHLHGMQGVSGSNPLCSISLVAFIRLTAVSLLWNWRLFYPNHPMAIEGKELAIACARAAEEIQAEDIRVLDLTGLSTLTDFMVVCSGTSLPHLRAVMRDVDKTLVQKYDVHPVNAEGNVDSRWVVLDFIDVMVHIMHQDMRDLYGLEDLWAEGQEVEWEKMSAE